MLVVNRFRVDATEVDAFRRDAEATVAVLAAQRGCLDGWLGQSVDEPSWWLLCTRWTGVGDYRRALSSYDVRTGAWPLLARALDEPSAYEVVEPRMPMTGAR